MAWVEKTSKDKGHAWRVGYRGPDRRQRYRTFTRKADADLFAVVSRPATSSDAIEVAASGRVSAATDASCGCPIYELDVTALSSKCQ